MAVSLGVTVPFGDTKSPLILSMTFEGAAHKGIFVLARSALRDASQKPGVSHGAMPQTSQMAWFMAAPRFPPFCADGEGAVRVLVWARANF
jgi:hypothetical protein